MKHEQLVIKYIPAIIYGEKSDKVYLFVHGQGGNKEEAESFADIVSAKGWQVLSIDLPGHGNRKEETDRFYPWIIVPELQKIWEYIEAYWNHVSIRANSIGAWFCMLAFYDNNIEKSLFVSPILDMEHLICNMMQLAGVTEKELEAKKIIQTGFGETLSRKYLLYARKHPITKWHDNTAVLYGNKDNLTERYIVDTFIERFHYNLTVVDNGKHWLYTQKQLAVLNSWEMKNS